MQITAAVLRAPGEPFQLEELEIESPRADEVLVALWRAASVTPT